MEVDASLSSPGLLGEMIFEGDREGWDWAHSRVLHQSENVIVVQDRKRVILDNMGLDQHLAWKLTWSLTVGCELGQLDLQCPIFGMLIMKAKLPRAFDRLYVPQEQSITYRDQPSHAQPWELGYLCVLQVGWASSLWPLGPLWGVLSKLYRSQSTIRPDYGHHKWVWHD